MRKQYKYEVDYNSISDMKTPISCFPVGFDKSNLLDITTIADRFRKYLNHTTGQVIDCGHYYELAMKEYE